MHCELYNTGLRKGIVIEVVLLEHIKMNYISLKNLSTFIEQMIYGKMVGSNYFSFHGH